MPDGSTMKGTMLTPKQKANLPPALQQAIIKKQKGKK